MRQEKGREKAKRHFYERENAERQRIYVAIFSPGMFVARKKNSQDIVVKDVREGMQ